jgi:hypothetical protein
MQDNKRNLMDNLLPKINIDQDSPTRNILLNFIIFSFGLCYLIIYSKRRKQIMEVANLYI